MVVGFDGDPDIAALQEKKALEKLAEKEFSSVSGIMKKAVEKYLKEQGIDWRKPEKKK